MVNVGDRVQIVAGKVSVFDVLEIDGDRALVRSAQESARKYPFRTIATSLGPTVET